jgi:hypothetical protein
MLAAPPGKDDRTGALAPHVRPVERRSVMEVIGDQARRILTQRNIEVNGASRQWQLVLQLTRRTLVESYRRDRERCRGSYADQSFDPLFQGVMAHAAPASTQQSFTLGALIDRFTNDPGRRGRRDMTAKSYAFTFKILMEVIGESASVRQITRAEARRVQDLLAALPPNATKRFPQLTLTQAAEHAKAIGLAPVHAQTASRHLIQMGVLFNWAVQEDFMAMNPGEGLKIAKAGSRQKTK